MDSNDDINISKIKQEEIEYYKNKEEIEDIKRYLKSIKKTKITLDQSEILSLERIALEIVTNASERKLNIPRLFNSLKRFYIAYRKVEQNKDKIIKELYTDISMILSKLNIGYMINLDLIEERY
jgi:NADPH-dependent 7-cyano-7-deazaguanine reductase QueF